MSVDWFARWAFIVVLSILDAAWLWAKGVQLDSGPVLHQCKTAGVGLFIALALTIVAILARKRERLRFIVLAVADFTWTLSQLLIYLLAAAALEYLAASVDRPLADMLFARGDALLGFDWTSFTNWANSHPVVQTLFIWTYTSVLWQTGLVMLVGSATQAGDTNGDFVWNIFISGLICTVVFSMLPALGHDGLAEHAPIAALLEVRDPAWHRLNLDAAQGLVTFPSFHTALGIIFAYSVRRVRWIFWALAPFNAIMILSTLPIGGHYLIDVIAGAVLACGSICLTRLVRRWLGRFDKGAYKSQVNTVGTASGPNSAPTQEPTNP